MMVPLYFLIIDIRILTSSYNEITFKNLIDKNIISDSVNWKKQSGKILDITKVYGGKMQKARVILGIEYVNELNPNRKVYNLLNIPYLLIIGTTKQVGDNVDIVYNKNVEWLERNNAIYLPTRKDLLDEKKIKGIRAVIFLCFLILFFRKEIVKKSSK